MPVGRPVFACVSPHPPVIVPAVGRGRERETSATLEALATLRARLAAAAPDTLIVICPHGPVAADRFAILDGPLGGDLGRFGAGALRFERSCDSELVQAILEAGERRGVPLKAVGDWERDDHSAWVPLHFLQDAAPAAPVVMLSISLLPPQAHHQLGLAMAEAIARTDKRVAIIASADGSHALNSDGPYGFHPAGPRFEEEFQRAFQAWDVSAVLAFDDAFRRDAAEDAVPSLAILMGALSLHEARPRILAAEGPWGVGYMTGLVDIGPPETDAPVPDITGVSDITEVSDIARASDVTGLARAAVESHVREGRRLDSNGALPAAWQAQRAGTFVSIFASGELRGCVGTVRPKHASVAAEIVENAIAAAVDPRFLPVRAHELDRLTYKVDVLFALEPIAGPTDLDVRRYGVVVEAGPRRGVLLPDLAGVQDVEQQVAIARTKAEIAPDAPAALFRFEIRRYAE